MTNTNKYLEKIAQEEKKKSSGAYGGYKLGQKLTEKQAGLLDSAVGAIKGFAAKGAASGMAGKAVNTGMKAMGSTVGKIGVGLAGGALASKAISSMSNQQVKQAGFLGKLTGSTLKKSEGEYNALRSKYMAQNPHVMAAKKTVVNDVAEMHKARKTTAIGAASAGVAGAGFAVGKNKKQDSK